MKNLLLIICIIGSYTKALAQTDLLDQLEKQANTSIEYTIATFKGTRLINGHSAEVLKKNHLDYLISHRFGAIDLNNPLYDLIGMDAANTRMAFEYGLNDQLTLGVGRNSFGKTYDIYGKAKLLRQAKGINAWPITLTAFGSIAIVTERTSPQARYFSNQDRTSYTGQLLIARKFNPKFSAQVVPTFIFRNKTLDTKDEFSKMALGIGARYKLSKRIALTGEYYYVINDNLQVLANNQKRYNSASIGIDIETGGHVFQLHFSNAQSMIEKQFILETRGQGGQELHFGFNMSRSFSLDKKASGQFK
jgi:hypothetical protein